MALDFAPQSPLGFASQTLVGRQDYDYTHRTVIRNPRREQDGTPRGGAPAGPDPGRRAALTGLPGAVGVAGGGGGGSGRLRDRVAKRPQSAPLHRPKPRVAGVLLRADRTPDRHRHLRLRASADRHQRPLGEGTAQRSRGDGRGPVGLVCAADRDRDQRPSQRSLLLVAWPERNLDRARRHLGGALRDPQQLATSRARRCGRADRRPRRNCRPPRHVARQRCGALRVAAGDRGDRHVAAARNSDTHGADGRMTAEALDPLIHVPARLQIMAALATLPDGDQLSFKRLQDMIELTPGNLITHLRKLEEAGYLTTSKTGSGPASRTSVALTHDGRHALEIYATTLRGLLNGVSAGPAASGSHHDHHGALVRANPTRGGAGHRNSPA